MFNVEVTFRYSGKPDESQVSQGVNTLFGAWFQNGQILDSDCPFAFSSSACRGVVSCPERTSLAPRNGNKWVRKAVAELRCHGLLKPKSRLLGRGLESPDVDRCRRPGWYVLITDFLSSDSPLRCGEHYRPVPLYRLRPTDRAGSGYNDILTWQKVWKDFDSLWIMSGPGERFALRQICDVRSRLSAAGLDICRRIEKVSGVPTYYYLFRWEGRNAASERRRRCPSCGGEWLLQKPVHIFDFMCDRCRLVSQVANSLRT